jgi:hypothetical protein
MKNIILATLSVAFSIASFAGEKDSDRKLLKDLGTTLNNSIQVHWTSKADYTKATFSFNNKTAFAFYYPNENDLIGFGIQSDKTDLPAAIADAVKNKYGDWAVVDAMTFIDTQGYLNYFVQVEKNKKNLALKITPAGRVSICGKIYPSVNE